MNHNIKCKVIFNPPIGEPYELIDIENLKKDIIDNFNEYWLQGSGDGFFEYYDKNNNNISTLMLGPNINAGIYLHYIDELQKKDLLSLYNKEKLNEVLETAEEIYVSKGLFLPLNIAWNAIKYFMETGLPTPGVKWIYPEDIPENGNW